MGNLWKEYVVARFEERWIMDRKSEAEERGINAFPVSPVLIETCFEATMVCWKVIM